MVHSLWDKYASLQAELRGTFTVSNRSWAVEDFLNQLAAVGPTDQVSANDDGYVERAVSTAQRRERHRAVLRRLYLLEDPHPHPEEYLDARAGLRSVRAKVTKADWNLLCALAAGRGYTKIAAHRGGTVGALRVRVSRLRREIA